jgi:polysaccharide biosynthesis protein PslG
MLKKAFPLFAMSAILTVTLVAAPPTSAAPTSQIGSPLPRGTVVSDTLFGMHVAGAQNGVWPTIGFGSLRIWDKDTSWSHIESEPGVFDWTKLDRIVDTALANGVTDIMMVLAGTPTWASSTPTSQGHLGQFPGEQGMPVDLALWDRWVTEVVTRYQGRITSYQPWNEANLVTFFNGSPQQMAELTKRAYDIVKAVDPAAQVVAPSTGTRLRPPFRRFYPAYLRALAARGWPVDAFAAHTYPAARETPTDRQALINEWTRMLRAAGAPRLPLYDTEINFGLAGPGPRNPYRSIGGKRAQDWAARAYLDSLRFGIQRAYWYSWTPTNSRLFGIQMTPSSPAARSITTVQRWIVGARFLGCTTKRGGLVTCNFRKDGRRTQIVWAERGVGTFTALRGARKVCNLNNQCRNLKRNKRVTLTGPVLLTP